MKKAYLFVMMALLLASLAGSPLSVVQTVNLNPGDSIVVNCPSNLSRNVSSSKQWTVSCAGQATATPTRTATAIPSSTVTPSATSVPPTFTPVPPTATLVVPTSTPSSGLLAVDPAILGTCPASVHDRYVVAGPNGKLYRTWHPQVVSDGAGGTCVFAHEHGDDPASSLANSSLPPFGYAAEAAGLTEPHEGYKIAVINVGAANDEGGVASNSTRVVVHTGTGGAGRFDTEFHSAMFDLVSSDGHYVHLQGMADTGGVGSICADPRQGKTVVTLPGTGCDITSLYEIWNMQFSVKVNGDARVTAIFAPAVFDPITIMNPNDLPGHRVTYYATNYFSNGPFFGCNREEYSGPVYWYNASGPTLYSTDAYGNVMAGGLLLQQVSDHSVLGIQMSSNNQYQMKIKSNTCIPGLGIKN